MSIQRQHHLDFERYLDTLRGRRAPGSLAVAILHHALESCEVCRQEWDLVAGEQQGVLARLGETTAFPDVPAPAPDGAFGADDRYLPEAGTFAARDIEEVEARKRVRRRKVKQELWELLQLPPDERPGLVRRARKRFRSRALAEVLIAESRARVRTEPRQAESLASLVPAVLVRYRGAHQPSWATRLLLSAAAHRANAVRIAGDLRRAERQFRLVRQEIAERDVRDPVLIAEVASLEASVALDQRRFADADAKLSLALLLAQQVGERELVLRVLLQDALLHWHLGHPEQTLRLYDRAESLLTRDDDSYLRLSILTSRTLALCDLERFAAAEETLERHQEVFEEEEDVHTGAILCALRGRIALGLGRLEEAAAAFAMARDDLLAVGRHYDAALACLDLAESHLRRGDHTRLRKLAPRLLHLFEAHGVEREALGVIRLLAREVGAEGLTLTALGELRQLLHRQASPPIPPLD